MLAYLLPIAAVLLRVFGPSLLPFAYLTTVTAAGSLWVLAFLLYAGIYAPILLTARADGKEG